MAIVCYPESRISPLNFALNGPLTCFFILFGLLGNIYWLGYLLKQVNRSRWAMFLVTLAGWDSLLLASTLGFYGIAVLLSGTKPWNGFFSYFYVLFYPLTNMAMTGSLWTILAISVQRYLALARPIRWHVRSAQCTVRVISAAILAGCVLVSVPTALELSIEFCENERNQTLPQIAQSRMRSNRIYQLVYRVIFYLLFVSPLPFICIAIVTLRVNCIRNLVLGAKYYVPAARRGSCRLGPSDRTAALLTAMVLKFLVCYTPPTIVNILELFQMSLVKTQTFNLIVDMSNLLVVVQSSTNWLIYHQWRKQPLTLRASTNKSSFNCDQIRMIANLWLATDSREFGRELLKTLLHNNPRLRLYFNTSTQETDLQEELESDSVEIDRAIRRHAETVSEFFSELIDTLAGGYTKTVAQELRHVGKSHQALGIKIQTANWAVLKHKIIELLLASKRSPSLAERLVVSKFASFIIGQLRTGFLYDADTRKVSRVSTNYQPEAPAGAANQVVMGKLSINTCTTNL